LAFKKAKESGMFAMIDIMLFIEAGADTPNNVITPTGKEKRCKCMLMKRMFSRLDQLPFLL
jgi:hypothetical protein